MERFYRAQRTPSGQPAPGSRSSSVYSQDSTRQPPPPIAAPSTAPSAPFAQPRYRQSSETSSHHSRPASVTPSYMNAAVPARKPAPAPLDIPSQQQQQAQQQPPSPPAEGTLLCVFAAAPGSDALAFLERMLRRGVYREIFLVGVTAYEREVKELKMGVYGLLGKLTREYGVRMEVVGGWREEELEGVIGRAREAGGKGGVRGVLCAPEWEGTGAPRGEDVLELGAEDLQGTWRRTVGFVQGVARAAVPCGEGAQGKRVFLVAGPRERSLATALVKTTCDSLLGLIANSKAAGSLTVAYAETFLAPEPEPVREKNNGEAAQAPPPEQLEYYDPADFQGGESPTKLWNMWALQDEIGKY